MYEAKVWWASQRGDTFTAYLHLMQTGSGKRSAFAVVARTDGRELVKEATVSDYPLWSESPLGLTARALNAGSFQATQLSRAAQLIDWSLPENQVVSIDVSVALLPFGPGSAREIEGVHMCIKQDVLGYQHRRGVHESDLIECPLPNATNDACAIALRCLCDLVWGSTAVAPLPAPIAVVVRRWGKTSYVRLRDIPEEARRDFSGYLDFIECPAVPTEPDGTCAYAKTWEDFLSGKVRYETSFVPGVRFRVPF